MPDKPKHRHAGHRERVKQEFLARGAEGWPDHRVVELLLFYAIPQGDVNGLAHDLVERFGSLAGVLDASVDELKKVPGVGDHTAFFLHMLPEILGRYQGSRTRRSWVINGPEDAPPTSSGRKMRRCMSCAWTASARCWGCGRWPRAALRWPR